MKLSGHISWHQKGDPWCQGRTWGQLRWWSLTSRMTRPYLASLQPLSLNVIKVLQWKTMCSWHTSNEYIHMKISGYLLWGNKGDQWCQEWPYPSSLRSRSHNVLHVPPWKTEGSWHTSNEYITMKLLGYVLWGYSRLSMTLRAPCQPSLLLGTLNILQTCPNWAKIAMPLDIKIISTISLEH